MTRRFKLPLMRYRIWVEWRRFLPDDISRGVFSLPCAKVGNFAAGSCTQTHNNICIRGAGRDVTALENSDIATSDFTYPGLISLGRRSEVPTVEAGNDRLSNVIVSGFTLHQVKNVPTLTGAYSRRARLSRSRPSSAHRLMCHTTTMRATQTPCRP